jgi:hypothetical protein
MSLSAAISRGRRPCLLVPLGSAFLGILAWAAPAAAQDPAGSQLRRRGQFLRTEVLRTESEPTFTCTLAPTSGSYPVLLFRRQERSRQHEVRIYEVVIEERETDAETGRDGINYRVLPGEEVRGETTTRESSRDLGPFSEASFAVNGIPVRTDRGGLYVDTAQKLLAAFDDLSVNVIDLEIRHAEYGAITSRMSRYLALRWQDKPPEERLRLVQTDLLVALGADFEPVTPASRDGLQLTVSLPDSLTPGQECVLRVEARNGGSRPVACLLGRVFGRHAWLSGVNVYLGNVPPGSRREFERVVRVPDDAAPGPVFGVVGFWDILGPLKDAARPLSCVIAGTPTPPAVPPAAAGPVP